MERIRRAVTENKRAACLLAGAALLLIAAVILYACGVPQWLLSDGGTEPKESHLTVFVADVGQGDCVIMTCGGHSMIVDGGEKTSFNKVKEAMLRCGVKTPDYVAATHSHTDHIGSLAQVIKVKGAGCFLMADNSVEPGCDSGEYEDLRQILAKKKIPCISPAVGDTFTLGTATVTVLAPTERCEETNDCSLVLRVDYGTTSFLLAGDAGKREEQLLLESGADLDCDVLKVGHHGSRDASSEAFLAAVTPETAVISCGENNEYGHPNPETQDRLGQYTHDVYRTDWSGWVKVCSDGNEITVQTEKSFQ